jgi:ankyrin repeat protein
MQAETKNNDDYNKEIILPELLASIKEGNISRCNALIESGINLNQYHLYSANTPLNYAVIYPCPQIVWSLLNAGAQPEGFELLNIGLTYESENLDNKLEILSALIMAGVDINYILEEGNTLLMEAVRSGSYDAVKLIVELGANVDIVNRKGNYALLMAACAGKKKIYEYLLPLTSLDLQIKAEDALPSGLVFQQRSENQLLVNFMTSAATGNIEGVLLALKRKINVNAFGIERNTALFLAASGGHSLVVRNLIENGADVNLGNELNRETPLIVTTANILQARYVGGFDQEKYHLEIIKMLISAGADINAQDTEGFNALMAAANSGSQEAVEMLLNAGAKISILDIDGRSAVDYASESAHGNIVKLINSKCT